MIYKEMQASSVISKYVDCYWFFHNDENREIRIPIMPDGCMDIIFDISNNDILVCGTMTSAQVVVIAPKQKLFGIRFQPGILPLVLGLSAKTLQNNKISLADANSALYEKLSRIDTAIPLERLSEICNIVLEKEIDVEKHYVLQQIETKTFKKFRVSELARMCRLSVRQIERIFSMYVGVSPKRFLKIKRYQHLRTNLERGEASLVQLSMQCGYVDQAHMNKEYKQLTSATPMSESMSLFYNT